MRAIVDFGEKIIIECPEDYQLIVNWPERGKDYDGSLPTPGDSLVEVKCILADKVNITKVNKRVK